MRERTRGEGQVEKTKVSTRITQINHTLANSLDTFFTNVENIISDYSCMIDAHTHVRTHTHNHTLYPKRLMSGSFKNSFSLVYSDQKKTAVASVVIVSWHRLFCQM